MNSCEGTQPSLVPCIFSRLENVLPKSCRSVLLLSATLSQDQNDPKLSSLKKYSKFLYIHAVIPILMPSWRVNCSRQFLPDSVWGSVMQGDRTGQVFLVVLLFPLTEAHFALDLNYIVRASKMN